MINNMKNLLLSISPAVLGLALMVPAQGQGLPAGTGVETYEAICGSCHGGDIVIGSVGSRARWEETVESMRNRGAYGSDEEFELIVNYLAKYFGMPVNVNAATADELEKALIIPAAQAKAIVDFRAKNGNFASLADLLKVDVLDKADFALLTERLKFQ